MSLARRRDSSVQHFGCWALANVGWGQAGVQKFAREEGAMEAIKVGNGSGTASVEYLRLWSFYSTSAGLYVRLGGGGYSYGLVMDMSRY